MRQRKIDMRKKFEEMSAETFKTFVRMGRFRAGDTIHVTENLTVWDPDIDFLCHNLKVTGNLDLSGCRSLELIANRLTVTGDLTVDGCVKLRRLPGNLRKLNAFSAKGCEALTSIAPLAFCAGSVILTGCAALQPLPPNFRGTDMVWLDRCSIHPEVFCLEMTLPETIMVAAPGRRIGDLVDHRLLSLHPIQNERITETDFDEIFGETRLSIDGTSLVVNRKVEGGEG